MVQAVNIFWFRRDLRLKDNIALSHALSSKLPVLPIFIFDKNILEELEDRQDRRVCFIYNALIHLKQQLENEGSSLLATYDEPVNFFKNIVREYKVQTVFTNHDYEPYATERDDLVKSVLEQNDIGFKTFKDQVIFERDEIVKNDGGFYTVYTPYSNKWIEKLNNYGIKEVPSERLLTNFLKQMPFSFPSLKSMKFREAKTVSIEPSLKKSLIQGYDETRNLPGIEGTSRLGIHLRFGTISIRRLVSYAQEWNLVFLKELIWREFFMQILWHKPEVVHQSCKPEYDAIEWRNNEKEFQRWCEGKTGYPIVDAGMRQLNETGFMHNRVRMITASFLVKHLLVDWRWGEAYFAKKLLDYELASNNGNWQWVAGCGCDAAPYFRIFNPQAQTMKFDSEEKYIQQWVPEYKTANYPRPIVDHEMARKRCLETYKKALGRKFDNSHK